MEDKGKYYNIIMDITGSKVINGVVTHCGIKSLYERHFKGIYETIPMYTNKPVNKEEFIFSMTWVLADLFGGGSEVEVSEHAYDFIK